MGLEPRPSKGSARTWAPDPAAVSNGLCRDDACQKKKNTKIFIHSCVRYGISHTWSGGENFLAQAKRIHTHEEVGIAIEWP